MFDEMSLPELLLIDPAECTDEEKRSLLKRLALLLAERVGVAEVLNIINEVKERE